MRILNRLGGIELSSAYACIKAISKKKQDIIDQRRAEFLKGAVQRGVSEATAKEIFDLITFFAGYGFNLSHSAAYAQLSYQTAYLKTHYTAEFMAALLSSEIDDSNKRDVMVEHIDDARRLGAPVLAPEINAGEVEFTVSGGKILFGLTAIKGVGRGAAGDIVRTRKERGPFRDIFDFCERVDLKIVPRAAIEKLIKAGAFDCFGARRSQLFEVLGGALQAAAELQQDRRRGQRNFFDLLGGGDAGEAARPVATLPDIEEWPSGEKLKFEKEALDFYFSSHPLAQHEDDLRNFSTHALEQLANVGPEQEVIIGGMLTQLRFQNTKQKNRNGNTRYVRCKLEDLTRSVECIMWPDDFIRSKDEFQEDRICFVKGVVDRNRDEPGLRLSRVFSIEDAKRMFASALWLSLDVGKHSPGILDHVASVLRKSRGSCPVHMVVSNGGGKAARLKLGDSFSINPASVSLKELEDLLGPGRVKFTGSR